MNIWKIFISKIAKILLISVCCFIRLDNGQKIEFSEWDGERTGDTNKELDNSLAKPLCSSGNSLESCEDDRDAFLYDLIFNKRKEHDSGLGKAFSSNKLTKSSRMPPALLNKGFSCSCVMEHRLHDLGIMYFPRNIPIVICKPGSCFGGPYQCRPKEYKIQVLKQKQLNDLNREETNSGLLLPHNLRDSYISETYSVTVACECLP